jgi:hypothetical protein
MRRLWIAFLAVLVAGAGFAPQGLGQRHMRKYKAPPPMAQVTVTVVHGKDNIPLQNAAVVFHPKAADGKDDGNMELKTNEQGQTTLGIIPVGSKLLLQVIAPGYRTFGAEYDVPTDKKAITVKLLPPNQQYSIYAKNPANSDVRTNVPQTQMGHAAPTDSPLLVQPDKKKHSDDDE